MYKSTSQSNPLSRIHIKTSLHTNDKNEYFYNDNSPNSEVSLIHVLPLYSPTSDVRTFITVRELPFTKR